MTWCIQCCTELLLFIGLQTKWSQEFKLLFSSVLCFGALQAWLWTMLVRNDFLCAVMSNASLFFYSIYSEYHFFTVLKLIYGRRESK